jgi:tetratricopeptide (TPR) repeat protein
MMTRAGFLLGVLVCCLVPGSAFAQASVAARLLVLPFENAGREPRVFWLGEGSSVILTDDLLALGMPVFSRDDRLKAFERLEVPDVASLSHATAIRLAQALAATEVIIGDFELSVGQLTVRARPIRLDTGRIGPEIVERGPLTDLFGVYARVARRLVPAPRVTLEAMEQGHPPLTAFEVYVKGLLAEAPATRLSFLNQALRLAPEFQRARIALWDVHTEQNEHQRAFAIARQVPADHRLGRPARFLASISLLHMSRHQEAYDAMTGLNRPAPDAAVLNNLGVVQLRRPPTAPGGRAVPFFEQARQLDADDRDLLFNLGYAHWLNQDVISSTYWLREAVRRSPSDAAAHYVLGVALQAAGNASEAAREKETARRLSSDFVEWERKQAGVNAAPRGLERVKTTLNARMPSNP